MTILLQVGRRALEQPDSGQSATEFVADELWGSGAGKG